jgi:transglutaminase-like putative cysteine protease
MVKLIRVEHRTQYIYETPVSMSHHVGCLEPRTLPYQHLRSFDLVVDPVPAQLIHRADYFGNTLHQFQLVGAHDRLTVTSHSVVELSAREPCLSGTSESWERVACELRHPGRDVVLDVTQYLSRSPQVVITSEIAEFARASFPEGRELIDGALDLTHRIHDEFTFDPSATTAATAVEKMLADRRGVCQDFAHFEIACLRSLGLAARYVSGYLLTDPPPGQPRLIGADASHAWISIFAPDRGWIDLDPTNDVVVTQGHVTIGWGRDYGDVTPLRGVLLGGAKHQLLVGVSVIPLEGDCRIAEP